MKKYAVMAVVSCSIFSYAMEQTPLMKADKEQERHKFADECAEKVRDQIDKEILGIDENGWFRKFTVLYYTSSRDSSLTTQQEVEQELDKIVSYIPSTTDHELVMNKLMGKYSLFFSLVNRAVDHEVNCLHNVKGCTIDDCLKVKKIAHSSQTVGNFIKARALERYQWQKDGCTRHLPSMSFDCDNEIHFVPLFGHKNSNLGDDKLLMSNDSKYLRAIDNSGRVVVWDMESGNTVDIETAPIAWTRLDEDNHHCRRQRVIDKNGKYLATEGMALAFGSNGIHKIQNKVDNKYSFPVIMLFVRPTLESHLCQNAFVNSKGDEAALKALLQSHMLNNLKGFPAVNLKDLITQELERLQKQQSKL